MAELLTFGTVCLEINTALRLRKCHTNERHLFLVEHSYTKLLQNMCLINSHIWCIDMPQMWLQVMDCLLILLRFFGYFHKLLFLKYCIFTKLSQIVCQHIKCDCRLWKVLWFNCIPLGIFNIFYYVFETLYKFIKLLKIVY